MSLLDRARDIIESERKDPPPDRRWFLVQIKRFESEIEEITNIGYNEPSGSIYRNEAFAARDMLLEEIERWNKLYGNLA
jgi:hypothetical protein